MIKDIIFNTLYNELRDIEANKTLCLLALKEKAKLAAKKIEIAIWKEFFSDNIDERIKSQFDESWSYLNKHNVPAQVFYPKEGYKSLTLRERIEWFIITEGLEEHQLDIKNKKDLNNLIDKVRSKIKENEK